MSFYYLDTANTVVGPMELSEIACLVEGGTLPEDVLVCRAEEESWRPLSSLIPDTKTPDVPKSGPSTPGTGHWLPGAVLTTGIVALLLSGLPVLAGLLGTAAIGGGVAHLSGWNSPRGRGLAIGGVVLGSLALLAVAGGLIGSEGTMSARAISKVLKEDQDIVLTAKRAHPDDPISQTRFIAERIGGIDTSDCPGDFRYAFQQHINAWEMSVPYVSANTSLTAFFEGLYAGYTEDYRVFGLANQQAQLALREVDRTFDEVRSLAARYGATMPR